MPCIVHDTPEDYPNPVPELKRQIATLEASLCAALSVLEGLAPNTGAKDAIQMLDLAEAGVSEKKLRKWWTAHQKKDADRRRAEAENRRKEELKAAALSKLSEEERKVLGIK